MEIGLRQQFLTLSRAECSCWIPRRWTRQLPVAQEGVGEPNTDGLCLIFFNGRLARTSKKSTMRLVLLLGHRLMTLLGQFVSRISCSVLASAMSPSAVLKRLDNLGYSPRIDCQFLSFGKR